MLNTIYIESLFDAYTYTLDLKAEEVPYRFITGPNGYGKTSILNMLNALYTNDLNMLSTIPFKTLHLVFSDQHEVVVNQERNYIEEEGSDERNISNVCLHLIFKNSEDDSPLYTVDWNSSENDREDYKSEMTELELYFSSHPIYYIRDGRIRTPEGEPTIKICVERMKELLRNNALSESSDFNSRLQAFCKIIAQAAFAHKSMQTDLRYGFRFIADNDEGTILSVNKLSSGEQHLLIMVFELLFAAPDDSLVLIDEPEMSFHMLWQVDFLRNLQAITELRDLQCIACTHSPQIFKMNWELTIDLYTQSNINAQ